MAGAKWAHKIQLGRESTAGTAVAATTVWRGPGGNLKDNREVTMVDEQVGVALPTTRNYIGKVEGALSMAASPVSLQHLLHIFEAGIKSVGTGSANGAGTGFVFTYPVGMTSVNTIKTYTIETGDNQQAEEMAYCFVEKFTLSGEKGQAVMMSADWIGRQVANSTFTDSLTILYADTPLAGKGSFYVDAIGGTIGSTQVSQTLLKWELTVTTGWRAKYTVDSGELYFAFAYFDRDSFKAEFSATYEHNSTAVAQKALFQAGTPRLFRLDLPGNDVLTGTITNSLLRIDMAAVYSEWDALDAEDGNSIATVKAQIGYDPTAAKGLEFKVVQLFETVS